MENVLQNFESQQYDEKELIIILNNDSMDISTWKQRIKDKENISLYQLPERYSLGQCLNFGIKKAKYNYIAKFDDDDYYSPYYLKTMMPAFQTSNADIIGKTTYFAYIKEWKKLILKQSQNENMYTNWVAGGTIIFKKSIFDEVQFRNRRGGSDVLFLRACKRKSYKIYATSKYNYVMIRRDRKFHTWKIDHELFMKRKSQFIAQTDDFKNFATKQEDN